MSPPATLRRPTARVRSRSAARTRARILDAATTEFAAKGFAGARIGRIAKHAGVNRAMLYYYFGNKRHLFRDTVRSAGARVLEQVEWNDAEPLASLLAWWRLTSRDPRHLRLLEWALLEGRASDAIGSEPARDAFASLARLFADDARARHKAWLLVSAATLPIAWPQLTQTLVGDSPSEPRFGAAHERLLEVLADALAAYEYRDKVAPQPANPEPWQATEDSTPPGSRASRKGRSDA
jgi:TetR/AcrR family transcriptional regulator